MNSETKAYSELLAIWRNQPDKPTETPLSRNELDNIFSVLSIKLTEDVVALYSITGGMSDGYPDDRMFELWGRECLIRENTESRWDYCWIADWLISSHIYAVKPIDDEHSAVYIDHVCDRETRPEFLAASVYEFAEMLLHGSSIRWRCSLKLPRNAT